MCRRSRLCRLPTAATLADVDDLRESPAIEIAGQLARRRREDPNRGSEFGRAAGRAGGTAECLVLRHPGSRSLRGHRRLLVEHSRFRKIPREELMRRVVIDVTGLTTDIVRSGAR
jgi:UDP-N-acetyl-D-mannosaminuronate dehydrogenase